MALPYEVGLYYKFDMGMPAHRPIGCPGLDTPVDQFPGAQGILEVLKMFYTQFSLIRNLVSK